MTTQETVVAEIRSDLEKFKTLLASKDAEIASLKKERAEMNDQITALKAKVDENGNVSPDLEAAVNDLHDFAQSASPPAPAASGGVDLAST